MAVDTVEQDARVRLMIGGNTLAQDKGDTDYLSTRGAKVNRWKYFGNQGRQSETWHRRKGKVPFKTKQEITRQDMNQSINRDSFTLYYRKLDTYCKVRYTEYYLIFSTITCIPDIVEVCSLGALYTQIFSSETLPPQNDHITILATPQKIPWLHHCLSSTFLV